MLDTYRMRAAATDRYAGDADAFMTNLRTHFDVVLAVIGAGRAELIRQHRKGQIEDETLHDLERDLEELSILFQRGE